MDTLVLTLPSGPAPVQNRESIIAMLARKMRKNKPVSKTLVGKAVKITRFEAERLKSDAIAAKTDDSVLDEGVSLELVSPLMAQASTEEAPHPLLRDDGILTRAERRKLALDREEWRKQHFQEAYFDPRYRLAVFSEPPPWFMFFA